MSNVRSFPRYSRASQIFALFMLFLARLSQASQSDFDWFHCLLHDDTCCDENVSLSPGCATCGTATPPIVYVSSPGGWMHDVGALGSGNSEGDGPKGAKPKKAGAVKKKKVAKAIVQVAKAAKKMTKSSQVKGKGGFFSDVWNQGKTLLGQGLHKGIDFLSGRAKDAVRSLVGHGDYQLSGHPVAYNSLYAGAATTPKFGNGGESGNIIQHRESLGVIQSSVGFARTSMTLNPGLPPLSWLPRIAPAWQRWKLHGAIVEWIPRVPDINVNSGGTVVMSSRYDLTTSAPQSVQEAEITWGAITGRPMDKMAMPIECKNSLNPTNVLNVRFGALPAGANAQFFDHCIIDICTFGQTGVVNIGEVFITFEIEFLFPTAETITNSTISSYVGYAANTSANPYGTAWTVRGSSAFTPTITQAAGALTIDFVGNPLPLGSTWMAVLTFFESANVTTNSSLAYAADLAVYSPVFKTNLGVDSGAIVTSVAGGTEIRVDTFRVGGATGNQTLLYTAAVLTGGATGYICFALVPIVSTLTLADQHMRHRFPKLFEMSDLLEDLKATQLSLATREDAYDLQLTRLSRRQVERRAREDESKETHSYECKSPIPAPERELMRTCIESKTPVIVEYVPQRFVFTPQLPTIEEVTEDDGRSRTSLVGVEENGVITLSN